MEITEVKIEPRADGFWVVRSKLEQLAKSKNVDLLRKLYRARPNYKVVRSWS